MIQNLGLDFIDRTLRTTGVVLLVILSFCLYYLGIYPALAILSGGVWSMVNLMFLSALVRAAIRPDKVDKVKVTGLVLLKFPLLYVSGYFLLKVPVFDPIHLIIGFSVLLGVVTLKVIGRALFGLDAKAQKDENMQEAL
ncbi:MAG: hypothetical protein DRP47_05035 [Candidatus Zixiibacteriota bacterium]|nr:MAG: hypothetical protein DRP47_05035 [candidate division Zixibacteria bacterium]